MARIAAREKVATRQRLVDAAKSEFAERGLAGARFDQISLAAGCAKGTIYNYFASKEALFFTIVGEWCQHLVQGFVANDDRGAAMDLLEIARLDVEIARKDPDLARVVINHVPALADQHRAAMSEALQPGLDLLSDVIDRGQATGELVDSHAAPVLARLFLATMSSIEQEALENAGEFSLDDALALVERVCIDGIRA